jgi:ATP synthase subunit 6
VLSPLEHFEVLAPYCFAFSSYNHAVVSLSMLTGAAFCSFTNFRYTVHGFYSVINTAVLLFCRGVVYAGLGRIFFQYTRLLLSLFLFLFLANAFGLFPYAFAITGQLSTTLFLSATLFLGVTAFGIRTHGKRFSTAFLPSGAPGATLLLLSFLEAASYAIRPASLGIRLFANIMAGHALAQILSTLFFASGQLTAFSVVLGLVSGAVVGFVMVLETVVAALQSYVFLLLVSVYFNDAVRSAY